MTMKNTGVPALNLRRNAGGKSAFSFFFTPSRQMSGQYKK
jgi:hypothetical protein